MMIVCIELDQAELSIGLRDGVIETKVIDVPSPVTLLSHTQCYMHYRVCSFPFTLSLISVSLACSRRYYITFCTGLPVTCLLLIN